jgi:hypothetical protein
MKKTKTKHISINAEVYRSIIQVCERENWRFSKSTNYLVILGISKYNIIATKRNESKIKEPHVKGF